MGVADILKLSTKEFFYLVLFANIFALPIARYFMNQWLSAYAFRVSIDWTILVTSALLVLVIAIVTVSFEAVKAAVSNPVDSLRNE